MGGGHRKHQEEIIGVTHGKLDILHATFTGGQPDVGLWWVVIECHGELGEPFLANRLQDCIFVGIVFIDAGRAVVDGIGNPPD